MYVPCKEFPAPLAYVNYITGKTNPSRALHTNLSLDSQHFTHECVFAVAFAAVVLSMLFFSVYLKCWLKVKGDFSGYIPFISQQMNLKALNGFLTLPKALPLTRP